MEEKEYFTSQMSGFLFGTLHAASQIARDCLLQLDSWLDLEQVPFTLLEAVC